MVGPSGQLCECLVSFEAGYGVQIDLRFFLVHVSSACLRVQFAKAEDGQQVIGCIDIRVPQVMTGKHPAGVPDEDGKVSDKHAA